MTGTEKTQTGPGHRYERVRSLGKDGPFQVEAAWPVAGEVTEQTVLLKRLRAGWQATDEAVSGFIQDSLRASVMVHPNIVRVLHAGTDDDGLFVVTEYIHGVKLSALLRRMEQLEQHLSRTHALQLAAQCCRALERAQQDRSSVLVHGALGPDHAMITFDGRVRLKDFGVWRLLGTAGELRRGGLETYFLAPEQLAGHPPGPGADLYGIGRLLRYLVQRQQQGETRIDPRLEAVLQRCQQPDPAARYPDAAAFLRDLQPLSDTALDGADPGGLGRLVRTLFTSRKRSSRETGNGCAPGTATPRSAPRHQGANLLDPAMFWSESTEPEKQGEEAGHRGQQDDHDQVWAEEQVGPPPPPTPLLAPATREPLQDTATPPASPGPLQTAPSPANPVDSLEDNPAGPAASPPRSPDPAQDRPPPASGPPRFPGPPRAARGSLPGRAPAAGITTGRPVRAGRRRKSRTGRAWAWLAGIGLLIGGGLVVWQTLQEDDPATTPPKTGEKIDQNGSGDRTSTPGTGPTITSRQASAQEKGRASGRPDRTGPKTSEPAGHVRLELTSDPAGAVVFIDGEKRGATPTRLDDIPTGRQIEVRFELEGHRTWKHGYTFAPGARQRAIHAGLLTDEQCKQGAGWVYVSSDPSGATIDIDGKRMPGKTPRIIDNICAAESHIIVLKKTGYKSWRGSFRTSQGQVTNVTAQLEP